MPNTQLTLDSNTALTVMSETDLQHAEDTIRTGKDAFIAVGNALMQIRDGRGYTFRNFKTFEQYCDKVWGFSDRHARRLMSGAETAETVKQITGATPANEAVAREFARIANDPKKIERVAAKLKSSGGVGSATAERVATVIAQVTHKAEPAANGKAKPAAPKPTPPPTFTDVCPHCGMTPVVYNCSDAGWHCGLCDQLVFIGVVSAAEQKLCKQCDAPLAPRATFCANCGATQ